MLFRSARTACGPAPRPEISPSRRRWPDSGRCHNIRTRRPAGIRRLVPSHGQRAQSTRACSSFAHRRRARQSETLRDTPELRSRTASTHPGKRPCSVIPAEHVRQSCYTIRACRTMNPVSHSLSDPISPRGSHHIGTDRNGHQTADHEQQTYIDHIGERAEHEHARRHSECRDRGQQYPPLRDTSLSFCMSVYMGAASLSAELESTTKPKSMWCAGRHPSSPPDDEDGHHPNESARRSLCRQSPWTRRRA